MVLQIGWVREEKRKIGPEERIDEPFVKEVGFPLENFGKYYEIYKEYLKAVDPLQKLLSRRYMHNYVISSQRDLAVILIPDYLR